MCVFGYIRYVNNVGVCICEYVSKTWSFYRSFEQNVGIYRFMNIENVDVDISGLRLILHL